MEYIGVILAGPDPPGIDLRRWKRLVRQRDDLDRFLPRFPAKPTTDLPIQIQPLASGVGLQVIGGGRILGCLWLKSNESNRIEVSGERSVMISLANEIAGALDARFDEWQFGEEMAEAMNCFEVRCLLIEADAVIRKARKRKEELLRGGTIEAATILSWLYPGRPSVEGN